MFDLEQALNNWKKSLRKNPEFETGDIEELHSHLLDRIEVLKIDGATEQEAFQTAVDELGDIHDLDQEWKKTRFSSPVKQQEYMIKQSIASLLPSYVSSGLRNMKKRFGYSLINILGLSTGLATCILILFFVNHELSYDTFHPNSDRIYRVINSTNDGGTPTNANGSYAAGLFLHQDYPDKVEDYGRIRSTVHNSKMFVSSGENRFYEDQFFFADEGFLRIMNFPLLNGYSETALERPQTIILTQKMAEKYFGQKDPIGQTLNADPYQNGELIDFEVTGVLANIPKNTHFNFEFLASWESQTNEGINSSLGGFNGVYTYVKLSDSASPNQLEARFDEFQAKNWTDDPWYTMSLQPIQDIHLHSRLKSEITANGNITYVYTFSAVAILILIIACINFVNLSTAQSTERAREVSMRKVMGAQKGQLIGQFLGEAILLTLVSGVAAISLIQLFLPVFNNLTQKDFQLIEFLTLQNISGYLAFLMLIGIFAGFYPALVLSSFKSINVLKGKLASASKGSWLRKTLVVSQFSISAILIISTIIIYQQINFIKNTPLGYAKEQILTIPLNPEAREQFEVLKSEWKSHSAIQYVTSSSHVPTSGTSHNSFNISGLKESISMATFYIDPDFSETYSLNMIAGNDISNSILEPDKAEFLVSELAIKETGLESPEDIMGRIVTVDKFSGPINGVTNNMILYGLREQPYSLLFFITPIQYHKFISVRINTDQTQNALAHLEGVWNEHVSSYPLEYSFLDDKFEGMHLSDQKMAETITYFAVLAILVACLGLFGLAAYIAERKRKEIGVRKVLGATIPQIIRLLSFNFLKLIFLSLAIGIPVAWYGINKWLQEFVYKIEIQPMAFIMAAGLLFAITFLTISYQAIKSAQMNPVNALR
jgi:putative ABC transport system permease protein